MDRAVRFVDHVRQRRRTHRMLVITAMTGLAACSSPMPRWQPPRIMVQPAARASAPPPSAPAAQPGMMTPAWAYCLARGGQMEATESADGSGIGVCVGPRGHECEAGAFLYGHCAW